MMIIVKNYMEHMRKRVGKHSGKQWTTYGKLGMNNHYETWIFANYCFKGKMFDVSSKRFGGLG